MLENTAMTDPKLLLRARAQYASLAVAVSSLDQARRLMEESVKDDPIPDGISISPGQFGTVRIERVTPTKADSGTIVYAHGGGYIAGSLVTHRALTGAIALATRRVVIAVEYRRAPEHIFPAAIDDMMAVYQQLHKENPSALIGLAGDSAGAGLVLSVVARLKETNARLPAALVLIGPWVDLRLTGKSFESNRAVDPVVTVDVLRNAAAAYVGAGNIDHPWLTPLQTGMSGFPPMLIQVGSAESLRDDSINLADRAKADGVDVMLEVWPGMMHTWHRYVDYLPQAREALVAIGTFIDGVFSGTRPCIPHSALATSEQIAAERLAVRLLNDPAIKRAQAQVRDEVQKYSFASMQGAEALLNKALEKWTAALLLREMAADPVRPAILWYIEDTPYSWFGHDFLGGAGMGDNPDQVYRIAFVDGSARYEIAGKLARVPPVYCIFEVNRAGPGLKLDHPAAQSDVDMGNQVSILSNRELSVAPDGSFTITVGGNASAVATNHLRTAPGIMEISIREILADWNERPAHLQIRRLTPTAETTLEEAEVRRRTERELANYVHFWFEGNERWMGNVKSNTVRGPNSRDGGWGFLGAARYKLAPDEAILVTLDPCGASYLGLHITDPWMVVPDGRRHQTSLNRTQVVPNSDGTISYVISPKDPGVANWIDTAGCYEGTAILRWAGTPPGVATQMLVRGFDVIGITEIDASNVAGGRVTPEERRAQLARRAVDIAKRRGG
jgi:acetyl esterase/lipase